MRTSWPVAVVAVACIAAIVALSVLHADTTAMLGVLLTVIGGIAVSTHQQTNGNTTRLLDMLDRQSAQLAKAMPPLDHEQSSPSSSSSSTTTEEK